MRIRLLITLVYAALAQAQSFEVATIKPADPAAMGQRLMLNGPGRVSITNMTLVDLVRFAYGEGLGSNLQISGGPGWVSKDRYNVEAQAEGTPAQDQLRLMVRALLTDRFAMKSHLEKKEVDVYALVLARNDGKLTAKVQTWNGECSGLGIPPLPANAPQPAPAKMTPNPANQKVPRCAALFRPPGLILEGVTMGVVADLLSTPYVNLGRPVVDRTGLAGEYVMELEFAFAPPNLNGAVTEPAGPSIFTAVQEQWGLKLEPAKGQADVLVIEEAGRPSEN
jgi:uncharacterized protein (TIGR03435 family)